MVVIIIGFFNKMHLSVLTLLNLSTLSVYRCFTIVPSVKYYQMRTLSTQLSLNFDDLFEVKTEVKTEKIFEKETSKEKQANRCDFERLSSLLLLDGPENPSTASQLHLNTILALVKSDVQDRENDYSGNLEPLPDLYKKMIGFIESTIDFLRSSDEAEKRSVGSILRLIEKKEGLSTIRRRCRERPQMIARDIVEAKRKIERAFSEIMLFIVSYRSCRRTG